MKNYLRLSPFIHSRTGTALTCTQVILQILRVLDGESINDDSLEQLTEISREKILARSGFEPFTF